MNKKFFIQLVLFSLIIFLLFIFFQYYNNTNKKTESKLSSEIQNKEMLSNENLIKNMEYSSIDNDGNYYKIFSDFGKFDLEDPDLIFMTNVTAFIYLKDNNRINITSNFAKFNNQSFETEFTEQVKIIRRDEKITGDKLDFSLEKDIILLSNNIIFTKPGFNLKADKVEINITTKNSKIYMNNSKEKVIALGETR
jgi:LPS export ABC transporter protein LptC|tara:strand:- start:639 stop:1223 length:585 start_codon:yes stop_codon:yes gene_type:complete